MGYFEYNFVLFFHTALLIFAHTNRLAEYTPFYVMKCVDLQHTRKIGINFVFVLTFNYLRSCWSAHMTYESLYRYIFWHQTQKSTFCSVGDMTTNDNVSNDVVFSRDCNPGPVNCTIRLKLTRDNFHCYEKMRILMSCMFV